MKEKIALIVDDFSGGAFNVCRIISGYLNKWYTVTLIVLNKSVETRYDMSNLDVRVQNKKYFGIFMFPYILH